MRLCSAEDIKPGMVVARPIYDVNFRLLLNAGASLTPEAIRRIRHDEFPAVLIQEPGTEKIKVDELIGVKIRQEIAGALEAFASWQRRDLDRETVAEILKGSGKDKELSAGDVQKLIEEAIENLLREMMYQRRPVYYPGIYPAKNRLINHATNVTILSLLIGWRFRFSKQELLWLGRSALLHDVGKWRLAPELITVHPMDYTEELKISYSMHPQMSTVLLDQDVNINMHVTMSVLQHHERQDGTGFPERLRGSNLPPASKLRPRGTIHRFAEIIAVANYFDNLVSGRISRMQLSPADAVRKIIEETPQWFNEHITNEALEVINVFPVGSLIRVGDSLHEGMIGCKGVVAKMNPEDLHRPVVTLLYGPKQRLDQPLTVNFATDPRGHLEYISSLN